MWVQGNYKRCDPGIRQLQGGIVGMRQLQEVRGRYERATRCMGKRQLQGVSGRYPSLNPSPNENFYIMIGYLPITPLKLQSPIV